MIRSHYGHGFAKQYVRDDRILRTEPATNNVYDYGVNKDVENLPHLRKRMSEIIDHYHGCGSNSGHYVKLLREQPPGVGEVLIR